MLPIMRATADHPHFAPSLAASASGLPTAAADGTVTMTLHQVNQDGAGPYTCQADATGTGTSFADMTVTQQVPGKNVPVIGSLSAAKATNFTLAAQLPAGTTCSGAGGACLVRCMNAAIGQWINLLTVSCWYGD